MARAGMKNSRDLVGPCASEASRSPESQIYRIVGQEPERIAFKVLVALCDIFGIEAGDLITYTAADTRQSRTKAVNAPSDVPLLNAYRPVKARIVSDDETRRRGRPRTTGDIECSRCHHLVAKIRVALARRGHLWAVLHHGGPDLRHVLVLRDRSPAARPNTHRSDFVPRLRRHHHQLRLRQLRPRSRAAPRRTLRTLRRHQRPRADPQTAPPTRYAHQTTHRRTGSGPPPGKHHHLDASTRHRRVAHPDRHPGTATKPRSLRRTAPIAQPRAPARNAGSPPHDARPRRPIPGPLRTAGSTNG